MRVEVKHQRTIGIRSDAAFGDRFLEQFPQALPKTKDLPRASEDSQEDAGSSRQIHQRLKEGSGLQKTILLEPNGGDQAGQQHKLAPFPHSAASRISSSILCSGTAFACANQVR